MKRRLALVLIAVVLAPVRFSGDAQAAVAQIQTCTITGTVYLANGQPFVGAKLTVHRVRAGSTSGPLLSAVPVSYVANSQGAFSFQLPRDSFAWIEAPIDGLFVSGGVPVYIPNAGSVELRTLPSNVKLPQQVQVAILNPQSVLDPGASGVMVRTDQNVTIPRSIAVGSNLSIANATGVGGNPTVSLGPNVVTGVVDETNLHGSVAGNQLTFSWAGTLAKARQHAATVYNDAGNVWSTGAQDFGSATSFKVPTAPGLAPTSSGLIGYDSTGNVYKGGANGSGKTFAFTDSNITGNSATASALAANGSNCSGNNWARGVDAAGNGECAQPAFSNLSGLSALAQLPFGTANQLHKTNTGGTAIENATLSAGTSGSDFAVAFGAGTIALNLPTASGSVRGALASADWTTFNNKVDQASSPTWTGIHTWTPTARSSGTAAYRTINIPADTGLTASTEAIGINYVTATRQHATGALTTQREVVFGAPTYSFVGASTVTEVATVAITGPPIVGTNATFSSAFGLWVGNTTDHQTVPNQVPPFQGGIISGKNYALSGTGNIFQIAGWATNSGTFPTTAVGGYANTTGAAGYAAGGNFVGYVDTTSTTSAHGIEVDTGKLQASAASTAISLLSVTYGGHGATAHLWMQTGSSGSSATDALVVAKQGGFEPITDNILNFSGAPTMKVGFNMAAAVFSGGAATPMLLGNNQFIKSNDSGLTARLLTGIDGNNATVLGSGGGASPGSGIGFRIVNLAGSVNLLTMADATGNTVFAGSIQIGTVAFASLGSPASGTVYYCSDCANASNPCTGSSTGAIAKRLNGAWDCR